MPDLIKRASSEIAAVGGSTPCDRKQSLLKENERLREKVAEIVLQLDSLWSQFDPAGFPGRHGLKSIIMSSHRDNDN